MNSYGAHLLDYVVCCFTGAFYHKNLHANALFCSTSEDLNISQQDSEIIEIYSTRVV